MLLVHQHPENTDKDPQVVFSHQTVYERTGCDVNSRWLVEWKGLCQGLLMTDLDCAGYRNGTAVLQCQEGDLVIDCTCLCKPLSTPTLTPRFPEFAHPISRFSIPTPIPDTDPPDPPYQPSSFHIVPKPDRFKGSITETEDFYVPIAQGNNGTSYEADEVARCVRDGRIESERMTWEESRVVQGWFDTVRKSGPTKTAGLAGKAGL
jgi:hypothetical protein